MPAVARLSRMPRTPAWPMASSSRSGGLSSMTATPCAHDGSGGHRSNQDIASRQHGCPPRWNRPAGYCTANGSAREIVRGSRMLAMQVLRLGPQIGAEIRGVDVKTLDDASFAAIYRAWLDYNVVVVPGQRL